MKKNLTFLMLMLSALVSFTACSSDDDEIGGNKDAGSENTTDVAVTGAVQESGVQFLVLTGYVNGGLIPSSGSGTKMGIQIGRTNDDYDPNSSKWGGLEYVKTLDGRKMTAKLTGMAANHQWRFRTFVYVDGKYYFGETKIASTKDFSNVVNTGTVSDITANSAKLACSVDMGKATWKDEDFDSMTKPEVGVVWAKEKDRVSEMHLNDYERKDFSKSSEDFFQLKSNEFTYTLTGLQPNTTYYYCGYTYVGYIYRTGPIQSFTTPASGVK
jgi:hypothetical protein